MPGLVPGIYVLTTAPLKKTWMAGINPAMTTFLSDLRNTICTVCDADCACVLIIPEIDAGGD